MATQQAKPARQSTTCSALGERPSPGPPARKLAEVGRQHGRAPPKDQQEWQHAQHAEHADSDMRCPPAFARDEMLNDRRPDCAGDIIAAGGDGDGNAAPPRKPLRGVGDQRAERGGGAEPDQHVHEGEQCEVGSQTRGNVSDAERQMPQTTGARMPNRSERRPSTTPPNAKPTIAEREGKGRVAARGRELDLHERQHHRRRPHADAADGAEQQGGSEPRPGVGGFHPGVSSLGHEHGVIGVSSGVFLWVIGCGELRCSAAARQATVV